MNRESESGAGANDTREQRGERRSLRWRTLREHCAEVMWRALSGSREVMNAVMGYASEARRAGLPPERMLSTLWRCLDPRSHGYALAERLKLLRGPSLGWALDGYYGRQ